MANWQCLGFWILQGLAAQSHGTIKLQTQATMTKFPLVSSLNVYQYQGTDQWPGSPAYPPIFAMLD